MISRPRSRNLAQVQRPAPNLRGRIVDLSRRYVGHPLFGWALLAYALIATVIETIPVTFVLSVLTALKPARWKQFLVFSVLGSSIGALILAWLFHTWGYGFAASYYPDLVTSSGWKSIESWIAQYGMWAVAGIAAVPLPLTPAIALCGLMRMSLFNLLLAVLVGKAFKYSFTIFVSSRAVTTAESEKENA